MPLNTVTGDTYQRQLKYAGILKTYHLITQTPPDGGTVPLQLAGNFWVYPCGRRGMADYVISAVRTGWHIVQRQGVDVVSTQDPFITGLVGYLIARRFRLPLSLQFASDMVDNPFWIREKPVYRLLNRLAHWLIRRADTFRVVSTSEQEKLIRLGIPPDRIWNLGSITDFPRFLKANGSLVRVRYLDGRYRRLVLFVGRLVPSKDLPTLLRAVPLVLADHPRTLFLLVGDGPLGRALRDRVKQARLSDSVHFAGAVPYEQIPDYFAACDVFVLPSVYEGNARVLAEAAAAARPTVCTDVSGARDTIVDGKTGFIVPVGDHEALAGRLSTLLGDPELATRMGQQARQHILRLYDPERLLAGFRELWETTARMKEQR
jgi:glycosyltransferase involved in cell wall biosynthesis